MALQLNFNAETSEDCKTIEFEDTTGSYNDPDNLTGWGGLNKDIGDVSTSTIIVEDPAGNFYVSSIVGIDVFPTVPNVSGLKYSFVNTDIGLAVGDKITDGIWKFQWLIVFDDDTTATYTQMFLFTCAANCCVQKMLTKVEITDCCNDKLDDVIKARTYLSAAINAANCAKPNQAQALLDQVNYLCNKNNCNC